MKKLLTILLLFISLISYSQRITFLDPLDPNDKWIENGHIAQDKANHLLYGTVGTIYVTSIYYHLGWKNYQVAGAATSFAIGLGKEYFKDGRPSGLDMTANFLAVCLGTYIATQSCEKWSNPEWHKKRMQAKKLKKKYTVTNAVE